MFYNKSTGSQTSCMMLYGAYFACSMAHAPNRKQKVRKKSAKARKSSHKQTICNFWLSVLHLDRMQHQFCFGGLTQPKLSMHDTRNPDCDAD